MRFEHQCQTAQDSVTRAVEQACYNESQTIPCRGVAGHGVQGFGPPAAIK